jgi:hypothetical protein
MDELTEAEIIDRIARIADISARIRSLTDAKSALNAEIRESVKPGTKIVAPSGHTLTVTQSMQWDEDRARVLLLPEQLVSITRTVEILDEGLAKALLPPAAYEACKSPRGNATVTVR